MALWSFLVRRRLWKLKAAGNIDALIEAFADPNNQSVRRAEAADALHELIQESRDSVDAPVFVALARLVRDRSRPANRRTEAISMLRMAIRGPGSDGGAAFDALVALLDDDTEDPTQPEAAAFGSVRRAAVEALASFGERAFEPLLLHLEIRGADDPLAGEVLRLLVESGVQRELRLGNLDELVRELANRASPAALVEIHFAPVPGLVSEKVANQIVAFQVAAAHALAVLRGERALAALIGAVHRLEEPVGDLHVPHPFLTALATFDDPRAMGAIEDILARRSPDDGSWWDAAAILAEHGHQRAIAALEDVLERPQGSARRRRAARILSEQGSERGRRAHVEELVDEVSGGSRYAAVELARNLRWAKRYLGEWAVPRLREANFSSRQMWDDDYQASLDGKEERTARQAVEKVIKAIDSDK